MQTFVVIVQGITPLLQNRFDEETAMENDASGTRAVHIKKADRREVAEKAAYRNDAGELYLPGTAVARLLREAGGAHKQRGSRKSLKYIIPACVLVIDDQIVLRDKEGKAITKFEVDSRSVVIPSTKGRVMRHRPRIDSWHLEFSLEVDEEMIDPDVVHQMLTEGGRKNGLGDFRPEKGGSFGRFIVTSWAELAQKVPTPIKPLRKVA